jgi:ABC-type branched-subunit amino acid transport system ATPase component
MLLQVEGLTVRFGGVEALSDLNLVLAPEQVLGLMGANGCGKTTLFNAISGVVGCAAGRIVFRGRDATGAPPHAIARAGIARTFQTVRLLPQMSVADNVARLDAPSARAEIDGHLEAVGLLRKREMLAAELTLVEQRRLEIARALARSPALVLMDEPTAGLNPQETEAMSVLIREVVMPGRAVILTEHKGQVIADLCPLVALLDQGRMALQAPPRELFASPAFRSCYLGGGN